MENQFDQIRERRIELIRYVLNSKKEEYAKGDTNRYYNFDRASRILEVSAPRALIGMFVKHLVSVLDIVDYYDQGEYVDEAFIDEKIGDAINYLILLEGLLKR